MTGSHQTTIVHPRLLSTNRQHFLQGATEELGDGNSQLGCLPFGHVILHLPQTDLGSYHDNRLYIRCYHLSRTPNRQLAVRQADANTVIGLAASVSSGMLAARRPSYLRSGARHPLAADYRGLWEAWPVSGYFVREVRLEAMAAALIHLTKGRDRNWGIRFQRFTDSTVRLTTHNLNSDLGKEIFIQILGRGLAVLVEPQLAHGVVPNGFTGQLKEPERGNVNDVFYSLALVRLLRSPATLVRMKATDLVRSGQTFGAGTEAAVRLTDPILIRDPFFLFHDMLDPLHAAESIELFALAETNRRLSLVIENIVGPWLDKDRMKGGAELDIVFSRAMERACGSDHGFNVWHRLITNLDTEAECLRDRIAPLIHHRKPLVARRARTLLAILDKALILS